MRFKIIAASCEGYYITKMSYADGIVHLELNNGFVLNFTTGYGCVYDDASLHDGEPSLSIIDFA
jgi:hypothetical protein